MKQVEKIDENFKKSIDSIHELQASIGPGAPMSGEICNALGNLLNARKKFSEIRMKVSLEETNSIINDINLALQ